MRRLQEGDRCPKCEGLIRRVLYGRIFDPDVLAEADRGEVVVAGCTVTTDSPHIACGACLWPIRHRETRRVGQATVAVAHDVEFELPLAEVLRLLADDPPPMSREAALRMEGATLFREIEDEPPVQEG